MKTLIIAEKPSVARKITDALCSHVQKFEGYVEDENYVITQCAGHLLQNVMPEEVDEKYKKWSLDNLPFFFDQIPLSPLSETRKQLSVVVKCLKRTDIDEVVNACDPDREGELIFRNVYYYSKTKISNMSRMWIETVASKEALRESFKSRKKGSLYDNLYQAALARNYADYFIGLNSTEGMTVKFGKGTLLSVGRIQTPTLKLIVDLENQIKNFKSAPFYKIVAHTKENIDGLYYNKELQDNRFDKLEDCKEEISRIGLGEAIVKDVTITKKEDLPRLLYNLSDLQVDMNKRYKYSAQDVLNACQSLYEKHGLTTYPRTNENKISPELASKSRQIVDGLPSMFSRQKETITTKDYCLDGRVIAKKDDIGAHEALTPVVETISDDKIDALSQIELNVYKAIVERFLAAFYPNAVIERQEIVFERNNAIFKNKIENLVFAGHYEAYSNFKPKDLNEYVKVKKGDSLDIVELETVEGATQAPSRFTEGTLLKVMINPSKYVQDSSDKKILEATEGLGTEATRASIIEELKRKEYIAMNKSQIYPTEKGIKLIELIPSEKIKSVTLTAYFERKLSLIAKGEYNKEDFMKEIFDTEEDFMDVLKAAEDTDVKFSNNNESNGDSKGNYKGFEKKKICKCPNCKNDIIETKLGYCCSDYKNCKVNIYFTSLKNFNCPKINQTMAKELLTKGITSKKYKLHSNTKNKDFEAYLTYKFEPEKQYPNNVFFTFNNDKDNKK